jgi:hypothetical protein
MRRAYRTDKAANAHPAKGTSSSSLQSQPRVCNAAADDDGGGGEEEASERGHCSGASNAPPVKVKLEAPAPAAKAEAPRTPAPPPAAAAAAAAALGLRGEGGRAASAPTETAALPGFGEVVPALAADVVVPEGTEDSGAAVPEESGAVSPSATCEDRAAPKLPARARAPPSREKNRWGGAVLVPTTPASSPLSSASAARTRLDKSSPSSIRCTGSRRLLISSNCKQPARCQRPTPPSTNDGGDDDDGESARAWCKSGRNMASLFSSGVDHSSSRSNTSQLASLADSLLPPTPPNREGDAAAEEEE